MVENTGNPAPAIVDWEQQKSKLLAQFPDLRESDFEFETGQREEMLKTVQVKLGKSREELEAIIGAL